MTKPRRSKKILLRVNPNPIFDRDVLFQVVERQEGLNRVEIQLREPDCSGDEHYANHYYLHIPKSGLEHSHHEIAQAARHLLTGGTGWVTLIELHDGMPLATTKWLASDCLVCIASTDPQRAVAVDRHALLQAARAIRGQHQLKGTT